MTNVIAKYRLDGIRTFINYQDKKVGELHFSIVQGTTEENQKFFDASPSGEIKLGTVNQEVLNSIDLKKEYYIIITDKRPEGL